MAKEILQLNIASTSTVTYDPTIYAPYSDYDYNRDFKRYRDDIILENDDYYISHNGEYTQSPDSYANDVIVNGIVIWGRSTNGSYTDIIKTEIDLGTKKIYIPPRKIDNVYVEQSPVSRITFTKTSWSIQPYFDGVAYGGWTTYPSEQSKIADVSVALHPLYRNTRTFYSAAMLQYKAQWDYSQYPIFAAALNSMQYGAIAINPIALFTARPANGAWYYRHCFDDYEYIENLWLIPFANDDEYNAAYAVYYQWDDSDIAIINEYG